MTRKDAIVLACAAFAVFYIANPGAGVVELIPDNFPVIGNLDEAGAVLIIISALRYYGFDLSHLFEREKPKNDEEPAG